ncbi:hypothetical protein PG991_015209 [Apiospora marii]|uniref:C2H2-type domain-containing protein n=1 Tax=Apiospora marii TaxID=335849 RepID=A0ABR1R0Z2_9PEZI
MASQPPVFLSGGPQSPGQFSDAQTSIAADSGVVASSLSNQRGDVPPKLSSPGIACHYYKSDSKKYVDCLSYTRDMKNIKLHLFRCHMGPDNYCPYCGDKFPTEVQANDHIRARQCEWREFSHPGMNKDQQKRIKSITSIRGRGRLSDEEKWFEIWDVLFPDRPRPISANRGSVEEEMGSNLEEFMETPDYQALLEEHMPEFIDEQGKVRMATFISAIVAANLRKAIYARRENVIEVQLEPTTLDLGLYVHEQEGIWHEFDPTSIGN